LPSPVFTYLDLLSIVHSNSANPIIHLYWCVYGHKAVVLKGLDMVTLKMSSAQMVQAARARIKEIETPDLIAMLEDPDVVIVDLRDIRERQRSGYIPGSFHAPRGMIEFWIDPDSPYFKPIFGEDKTFVFHCASGWRSAITTATLQDMGFEAAHLKEGFSTWEDHGGPVEFPEKKD
jgi:rhodanese-related sulfurtransferase